MSSAPVHPASSSSGSIAARTLFALVVMLAGGGLVLSVVMGMNGEPPPRPPQEKRDSKFEMASKPPPKKKKPEPKPKPKPKRRATRSKAAPPPSLSSALGAGSFAMPGFGGADVQTNTRELLGDVKAEVMTADSIDNKPKAIRRVQPQLPKIAIAKGIEGRVMTSLTVNELGQVERVKILEAKPPGLFEQSVKDAAKQWQFEPPTYNGAPVKVRINQPFEFKLR